MTTVQALKKVTNVKTVCGDREMFWNAQDKRWNVYQDGETGRNLITYTKDQHTAVDFLTGKR